MTKLAGLTALLGIAFLFVLTSCEKEKPEDLLGSISIQLKLKEGLGDLSLTSVNLSLINTQDNVEKKMLTNQTGSAIFTALPAGTYNLNVSEPREDGEYTLTGTATNIVVRMKEETTVELILDATISNAGLVIKELYFVGAGDGYVSLFKDQFIEIFNNSSEVIYADGLHVGHFFSVESLSLPPSETPGLDIENSVYMDWVYKIPGTGKQYPIEPSKSLMIALNAINFKEGNPKANKAVDNSIADFEFYGVDWLEAQGRTGHVWDFDNPDVPNVIPIYLGTAGLALMDLTSPVVMIFRKENDFNQSDIYNFHYTNKSGIEKEIDLVKFPAKEIIDGVEVLGNSSLGKFKKLSKKVDASFTYINPDGGAYYNSKSLRRKIDASATAKFGRTILQDLNNSFQDFEVLDLPTPKSYN